MTRARKMIAFSGAEQCFGKNPTKFSFRLNQYRRNILIFSLWDQIASTKILVAMAPKVVVA